MLLAYSNCHQLFSCHLLFSIIHIGPVHCSILSNQLSDKRQFGAMPLVLFLKLQVPMSFPYSPQGIAFIRYIVLLANSCVRLQHLHFYHSLFIVLISPWLSFLVAVESFGIIPRSSCYEDMCKLGDCMAHLWGLK